MTGRNTRREHVLYRRSMMNSMLSTGSVAVTPNFKSLNKLTNPESILRLRRSLQSTCLLSEIVYHTASCVLLFFIGAIMTCRHFPNTVALAWLADTCDQVIEADDENRACVLQQRWESSKGHTFQLSCRPSRTNQLYQLTISLSPCELFRSHLTA